MNKPSLQHYDRLIDEISSTFIQGQARTIKAINAGLVMTYWQIGPHIVEFEQQGQPSAEYGKQLLANLSRDLKLKHGKVFSVSNLQRFRQYYLLNPNHATLSHDFKHSTLNPDMTDHCYDDRKMVMTDTINTSSKFGIRYPISGFFANLFSPTKKNRIQTSSIDLQPSIVGASLLASHNAHSRYLSFISSQLIQVSGGGYGA